MSDDDDTCDFGEPIGKSPSEEGVGFKRPPKDTRWPKGQSGNPRGRPKGSGTFSGELMAELRKPLMINEPSGRTRRISRLRGVAVKVVSLALKGDPRALAHVAKVAIAADPQAQIDAKTPSVAEDEALLKVFLKAYGPDFGEGEQ